MKKILITKNSWETRVAIVRNGKLENIYFGQSTSKVLERSFFKGKVAKILPGIQTAFVDIGQERAGFLHVSEIDRDLAASRIIGSDDPVEFDKDSEDDVKPRISAEKVDIAKVLHEGEPLLVQVSKEPVDEKGAKITTCFTLPGRFIVLTPNIPRIGVSKKIEDRDERGRLKDLIKKNLPSGMGAVIRTSAENRTEHEISKDIAFLVSDWKNIVQRFESADSEARVYEDMDISLQVVRDYLDDQVEEIITDDKDNHASLYKYLSTVAPEYKYKAMMYDGSGSLFDQFNIDEQINKALEPKASLKSGGSIVIDTTEALTVIDVNTGRFIGKKNMEDTILKTNTEAAYEVVRQLKLRNIGGLIVIDFIDMRNSKNRQKLVTYFEQILREMDKFQAVVLQVSEFGIVQMTRKRSGKTLMRQLTDICRACNGRGRLKSVRADAYDILANIKKELQQKYSKKSVQLELHPDIFDFISSVEFNTIIEFEKTYGCHITMLSEARCDKSSYALKEK